VQADNSAGIGYPLPQQHHHERPVLHRPGSHAPIDDVKHDEGQAVNQQRHQRGTDCQSPQWPPPAARAPRDRIIQHRRRRGNFHDDSVTDRRKIVHRPDGPADGNKEESAAKTKTRVSHR